MQLLDADRSCAMIQSARGKRSAHSQVRQQNRHRNQTACSRLRDLVSWVDLWSTCSVSDFSLSVHGQTSVSLLSVESKEKFMLRSSMYAETVGHGWPLCMLKQCGVDFHCFHNLPSLVRIFKMRPCYFVLKLVGHPLGFYANVFSQKNSPRHRK